MYKLFNDIWVESDSEANYNGNFISISEEIGFEYIGDAAGKMHGNQLAYGVDIESLGFDKLQEILLSVADKDEPIFIYTDNKTYVRLFAASLKALFPNINKELFTLFLLCHKSTIDLKDIVNYSFSIKHEIVPFINKEIVSDLFIKDDPATDVIKKLFNTNKEKIPFELAILYMRVTGDTLDISGTIEDILRRTVIGNSYDAMDDWGRVIMDKSRWDQSGCTLDSLLESTRLFDACINFGAITKPELRTANALDLKIDINTQIEIAKQTVSILTSVGDLPSANRTKNVLQFITEGLDLFDYNNCLKRLNDMFTKGPAEYRLIHFDAKRYNENLIRSILMLTKEEIDTLGT